MKDLVKLLERYGYSVKTFNNSDEVKQELLKEISPEDTIGFGGSSTLLELGIYDKLVERGNDVYWHWKAENKKEALTKANSSTVYLTSTNALTEDGKLVNIDGTGNRVSSMIFGHERVYFVVGKNKICKDYEAAMERIHTVASPKNAERLNLNTPCRITGRCSDCDSPDRMCKAEVVLHRKPNGTNIHIYLVDEELGF